MRRNAQRGTSQRAGFPFFCTLTGALTKNRQKHMIKNLRYSLAVELLHDRELLRAVAFSLLVRRRVGGNVVRDWSVSGLSAVTGVHWTTVRKRVRVLMERGLAQECGGSLVLRSLKSRHNGRNIRLAKIAYATAKGVERSLQAILVALMQLRKDFARRVIRIAHAGRTYKQVRAAQKAARRHGWGQEYVERGLGYAKMAKTLGVCVATAVKIVKFAEKRHILRKKKNQMSVFLPLVNKKEVEGCTFTTKNYGYKIMANTYEVAPCLRPGTIRL